MSSDSESGSRRGFITDVGRLASVVALASCAPPSVAVTQSARPAGPVPGSGEWDLSWMDVLSRTTDRAVFDWPTLGDPADPIVLQFAERYLDNCKAAYGQSTDSARVVLNARTQAVPAALVDGLWQRYSLGTEYNAKDPVTQQPAIRNPFLQRGPSPAPGIIMPTLGDLQRRGAIVLVCDFALGHLSKRLATKSGGDPAAVHRELRNGLLPGAFAVPSGIFGLARAQNSGCAYIRM